MVGVLGLGKGSVAVFLREEAGVVVGDLDCLVFEERIAEREEVLDLQGLSVTWVGLEAGSMETPREGSGVTYFFFVLVFGAHDSSFARVWPHGCYVDEEARLDVYPPCIDHVESIIV